MSTHQRDDSRATQRPGSGRIALLLCLLAVAVAATGATPAPVLAETPGPSADPQPGPSPATTPTPAPTGLAVLGDFVTFYGRGFGHGVGMSQYGARGRAFAGQDAATILAHYYQGAALAPLDPAARIRVLVLSKWAPTEAKPLVVYGRAGAWTVDGVASTFPSDARLRVIPGTSWRLVIDGPDGAVLFDGAAPAELVVRGATGEGRLQLWSKPSRYDRYRGNLRILIQSTTRLSVVNDLTLEQYLPGVVPVEMPSTWPAAALQAQSIAARSYAARRLRPTVSYFDVPDDSTSQVYRGVVAEKPSTNAAIAATAGIVLMSGGTIANALFHSTGGRATESNENVYTSATGKRVGSPVSYLRGASDLGPDGLPFDASAPYATWTTRTYARDQLSAWFGTDPRTNVGELLALDLRDRGVSGRLISVTLIGSAGTKQVRGELFRAIFNAARPSADPSLRSTLLDVAPIP